MERAFAAGQIDLSVTGDWEDAQIELGLKTKREHPRQKSKWLLDLPMLSAPAKKKKKTGVLAKKKGKTKAIAKNKKGKDYRVLENNKNGDIG